MNNPVIVSAVRTAIGNFGGTLRTVPAYDLGATVLNEVVKRANLKPEAVELVVLGQNYQNGEYVNISRMSLLKAGWPVEVPAFTMDRRCPSGLDTICVTSTLIQAGQFGIVVAGGVESMSTAELYLAGDIRWNLGGTGDMPKGHGSLAMWGLPLYDRIQRGRVMSQPIDRFGVLPSMMTWAETAAVEHKITRQEVDKWAVISNQRACAAISGGRFKDEIIPVPVPQSRGEPILFQQDERPRADTTLEGLAKLKPVLGGVCTAGNSSGENDGAAAVVQMPADKAKELGLKPMGHVKAYAFAGADPRYTYKSASNAVRLALKKAGLTIDKIDVIELHEAFAAQTLANMKELGLTEKDHERVNVNGSCVALGHPVGCTGARMVTTILYEMARRNAKYGLIGICGGGGMGIGAVFERP